MTGRTQQWAKSLTYQLLKSKRRMPPDVPPHQNKALLRTDAIRGSARSIAIELSLHLDKYWNSEIDYRRGVIDVVDMFSGCGGMSAGFALANTVFPLFRFPLAVDIDDVANRTYHGNLHCSPVAESVSVLAGDEPRLQKLLASRGRRPENPLILIGCAPCQGFSSHRNGNGAKDSRNNLFIDFGKVALSLRPDAVIVENVPELLTIRYWPYVKRVVRALESAGYYVHLQVYNLAAFGVPQERFRAVLLALRRPFLPPEGFIPRRLFRTVRQTIGDLPRVAPGEKIGSDPMHYSAKHSDSTIRTIRAVPKNGGSRPDDVGPDCLRRASRRHGRAAYEDVYGRLFWDRPSITITAYARNPASGRFVHPEQDRGLTIREAALLQSFPSKYSFSGSLDDCFRQIGNAVPPAFSSSLALHTIGELLALPPHPGSFDPGLRQPVGSSFSRLIPSLKMQNDALPFRQGLFA